MRRLLSAVAAVVVGAVLMGATSAELVAPTPGTIPDVIKAKRFEVVNDAGVVAVELDHMENFGRIAVRDDQGRLGVWIATRAGHGGAIFTLNRGVNKLVELSATLDGQGVVTSYDSISGRRLVDLVPNTRSGGAVVTYDGLGARSLALSTTGQGQGVVAAYDSAGGVRAIWPEPARGPAGLSPGPVSSRELPPALRPSQASGASPATAPPSPAGVQSALPAVVPAPAGVPPALPAVAEEPPLEEYTFPAGQP